MPPSKRKRIEMGDVSMLTTLDFPSSKYKNHLACPFSKHGPHLYSSVHNVCTYPPGFEKIYRLNDHINRVHSPKFGCIICKNRAPQFKEGQSKKDDVLRWKRTHICKPRDFTDEDAEWMTEEQEKRFTEWKDGKGQKGGAQSWVKIYIALFNVPENEVPSPYWDYFVPRYLLSGPMINESCQVPTVTDDLSPAFPETVVRHFEGPEDSQSMVVGGKPRLDLDALENRPVNNKYPFEWSVKPAIDSGYGTQDLQEPDRSTNEPHCSFEPSQGPLENSSAAAMLSMGILEDLPYDYHDYLNFEEETNDQV